MSARTRRAVESFAVSLLLVSAFVFFQPFAIFSGNPNEFMVPLASMLKLFLLPGLGITAVLTLTGILLPEKVYTRYISVLLALGILVWVQGNFMLWKYGLLDGNRLDWSRDAWRGWLDGSIWVAFLALSVVFHRRLAGSVLFISISLLSLKLATVAYTSFVKPDIWSTGERFELPVAPPDSLSDLSSSQNVIQFILDGYQSDIFYDIIKESGDYYLNKLDGFTFFRDTVGSFPTTKMSVPALLGGGIYNNNITMDEFLEKALNGDTIPNILHDHGYQVDLAQTSAVFRHGRYNSFYIAPIPYGITRDQYERAAAYSILDVALLRIAPHYLKRYVYNDQRWLFQNMTRDWDMKARTRHFAHKMFVQDVIDRMHPATDKPLYKFIHAVTPHRPVVVKPDCSFAGGVLPPTRENIKLQFRCSIDQIIEMFDKLRDLGLYDSSLIVLQGDHGISQHVSMLNADMPSGGNLMRDDNLFPSIVGDATPLLAIKPPGAKGPMKISETEAALTDIKPTVMSLVGIDKGLYGRSLFDIPPGESRDRKFRYYRWKNENWQADYFDHVYEFTVRGNVYDKASWSEGRVLSSGDTAEYMVGKIDFGKPASETFKYFGWSGNESGPRGITYNWAVGKASAVFISLPKDREVKLTAGILGLKSETPQRVTVKVDGVKAGEWVLDDPMKIVAKSVVVPPDADRPDVSVVEFDYDHTDVVAEDPYGRDLAALFESLTVE